MIAAARIAPAPSGDPALSLATTPSMQQWLALISGGLRRAVQLVRQLGPYAAIELLLPGGTLLAILLWLYRRHQAARQARFADGRMPSQNVTVTVTMSA
jgi:hypothetical protein